MNLDPPSDEEKKLTIILDISAKEGIDAGESNDDVIISDTIKALRADGYNVLPVRNAERPRRTDVGPLIEVITLLQQFGANVVAQKNTIDVLSELVTIFTAIVPIAAHIEQSYRKHISSGESRNQPIKITIELHDTSIEVEGPDLETAGASLELAKRYMEKYPETVPNVINKKSVNIKARVSKRQLRRRK